MSTNKPEQKLAYVGLGIMGSRIAMNLVKAGYETTVWNRSIQKCQSLKAQGAQVAGTLQELASKCPDVVFLNLSDTAAVETVLFGVDGLATYLKQGQIVVDNSSIDPLATRSFADRLNEQGVKYLDAPVTGGSVGAERGTLGIMVGGDVETFQKCEPILKNLGSKVTHMGAAGSGQACKICNQIAAACNLLGVAEALSYAKKAGLSPAEVHKLISSGAAGSVQLDKNGPKMINGDMSPGFKVALMLKDLDIAKDSAEKLELPLLGTGLIADYLRSLVARGHGNCGTQSLVMTLEALGGFTLSN